MNWEILFFSNPLILKYYLEKDRVNHKDVLSLIKAYSLNLNSRKPDHLIDNKLGLEFKSKSIQGMIFDGLSFVQKLYSIKFMNNNIWVTDSKFENWLSDMSYTSSLLFYHNIIGKKHVEGLSTFLAKPYNYSLSYIFENNDLHETHMHMNGTCLFDAVWSDIMNHPLKFNKQILSEKNFNAAFVNFVGLGNIYTNEDLFNLIKVAIASRNLCCSFIEGDVSVVRPLNKVKKEYSFFRDMQFINGYRNGIQEECLFLFSMLDNLKENKNEEYAKVFHIYILIKSLFHQFLVQQENQFGFDSFQRITWNKFRDFTEDKGTKDRLKQIKGNGDIPELSHLEGRVSTKATYLKSYKNVKNLVKDHFEISDRLNYDMSITGHFIKIRDSHNYYHSLIRNHKNYFRLEKESRIQKNLRNSFDFYKSYVKGIDAASNELHLDPSAFHNSYHRLKKQGLRCTYHTGEDFVHLLSGIRSVFEALNYLNLDQGDRLGHCTAIGLSERIWARDLPGKIAIKKGEWLDNLIFLAHLKLVNNCINVNLEKIKCEIKKIGREIYQEDNVLISDYIEAWRIRKFDPVYHIYKDRFNDLYNFADKEMKLLRDEEKVLDENPKVKALYKKYFLGNSVKRYDETILVNTCLDRDLIKNVQEEVIRLLNERNVAVEVMPTSNVRISQYLNYKEHHIFRWLKIDGYEDEFLKYSPKVVIATDNPGIFNTSLQNEYALIYLTLKFKYDLDEASIKQKILNLIETSKEFSFT